MKPQQPATGQGAKSSKLCLIDEENVIMAFFSWKAFYFPSQYIDEDIKILPGSGEGI